MNNIPITAERGRVGGSNMYPIMNGLFVASRYILIEFILTMCAVEVVLRHTQPSYKMLLIVSVDPW